MGMEQHPEEAVRLCKENTGKDLIDVILSITSEQSCRSRTEVIILETLFQQTNLQMRDVMFLTQLLGKNNNKDIV